ncbi:hypothetical protein QYF61_007334 [Mycteria americana]|uniref:Uncharacterized protein n=1 Tax=Mycteria americana TaxID=33587 RepID=A0AAN7MPS9_MYCAM|nr:hypothetical protein QYF61_007334 [Mycteria americana]
MLGKTVWVTPASGKGKPIRGIAFAQGPGCTWWVMRDDGEVRCVPQGDKNKKQRITESQNRIGWKTPLRSSSPTVNLTLPRPPLHHVPKHLIQTSFKYLQGWRLNHFPGQPVPRLDNPFSESKPPLAQLEAISSCPITCYLGEETDPHLSTTSFQVVVESDKASPQPPFLQAKKPQVPQPLLIRLLRCPSLDTLQHLNVSLVVGGPKLNTVFEVRPHQCQVQGHNHFPSPAGHAIFDTSQDAIGLLGSLGALLAHIQPAVNQHAQVLFRQAAFQPLFPKPVVLHGVAVAQVQDLALSLVEPHTIGPSPSIQPVQVPLQSLPPLQQINTSTQLGVICKLPEGALDPFVQIIDKDIKQNWPQHRALGDTACDRPPTGVNSIHHHSLGPAIQPVLYPAKSTPIQTMSSQFLQENAHLIQTSFKYLQGWRLNHFPGQPVPMLDNPLGEEKFPNIQSKPPLAQLEAISSCPITCYMEEETDPHLSTTSFQVVEESNKVSPQPPFLQAKQSQLPQPLLIRLLLQTFHQLRCPSLHTLQYLNIPLVVGGPKLNTVFEVRPHQCRVQGHNHFPSPAGHAIFDTSQDAIGFLGRLGTLLAHIQAAVNKHPQVLLCQAALQPLFPKPVALHGVAVAQVQDLALGLVKPHTIDLSPSIQPVQVPLQSLPTLKQINTPTQLGVVCKLTESTLNPFVQIIDKDVKQNWPQYRALGNTTCDWPPTGVNSIHHHSLGPAVQPVLYPAKSTPVQAMSSQFLQENAVGNRVKGFTEV